MYVCILLCLYNANAAKESVRSIDVLDALYVVYLIELLELDNSLMNFDISSDQNMLTMQVQLQNINTYIQCRLYIYIY